MFEIIDVEQRSPEWIEMRKSHIGGSDAPIIMQASHWKSPYDLWLEKTNLDLGEKYVSPAMQRGVDLEAKALECFNYMFGVTFSPIVVKSSMYPWMIASLDGMTHNFDDIVEIKCAGHKDHLVAINGKVPDKYYPQIQHQMAVTGLKFAYYFSFDGEDGVIVKVDRDQAYIDDLIAKEKEFWHCVETLTEPKSKYIEKQDGEWKEAAERYQRACYLEDSAKTAKELAKDTLIQLAGNQSNCRGAGITLQKVIRKGTIPFASLAEVKALNLESYRSCSTEYWKVDIT